MDTTEMYYLNIKRMCDVKSKLHAYFLDVNDMYLAANKLKLNFREDIWGCSDIISHRPQDFLKSDEYDSIKPCYEENLKIFENGLPKQCYQVWVIKGLYRLNLLSFKIPIYNSNRKPIGIFILSHFLNKFSVDIAYNLGLTKRETECLFYLLEGYAAKEIGRTIKLSPRTIEGYIDNMKNKLGCATTSELLLKALQSQIKEDVGKKIRSEKQTLKNPLSDSIERRISFCDSSITSE